MRVPNFSFVCSVAAAFFCMVGSGWSQNFPTKPIRILTSEPGGSADFAVRLIAPGLASNIGQPVIVENRPGGLIVAEAAVKANPDGYTLLYAGPSFMYGPLLQKMPYDSIRDFAPIAITDVSPAVMVVHQSVPAKTVRELINLAKEKAGMLNYASATRGSGSHLSMELFKNMAGVNIVRVPYKGGGPALTGLLAGEAQMLIAAPSNVAPHVKSGALRALAVTSIEPSALAPGLPTVAATGLPGYDWVAIDGMWSPKGTPAAVVDRLNREIVKALVSPDVKEKFFATGSEVVASSPQALADRMKTDIARMSKLIREAGIQTE